MLALANSSFSTIICLGFLFYQSRWLKISGNAALIRDRFDVNHDGRVTREEFKSKANEVLFSDLLRKYEKWAGQHEQFKLKEDGAAAQQ